MAARKPSNDHCCYNHSMPLLTNPISSHRITLFVHACTLHVLFIPFRFVPGSYHYYSNTPTYYAGIHGIAERNHMTNLYVYILVP